jgi:hypothetical protein
LPIRAWWPDAIGHPTVHAPPDAAVARPAGAGPVHRTRGGGKHAGSGHDERRACTTIAS